MTLTTSQALLLASAASSDEGKTEALRLFKSADNDYLAEMIMGLIELSGSVIENHDSMIRTVAEVNHGMPPSVSEKINLPDLVGALMGISIASGIDQDKVCESCAFRLGSIPNQCSSTVNDVFYCAEGDSDFMCHENIGDDGKCTRACKGYAQYLKQQKQGDKA